MEFQKELIERLKEASSIVFFTGAGISAESGIPTFRGDEGLWNKFKPEELANFNAFMRNPDMVWEWYQYRRNIISETKPNAGHKAIVEFEKYFDVTVVTQNVDNLHGRAGSKSIFELHGNIERNFCIDCKFFFNEDEFKLEQNVPKCANCGGMVRPDVVWFGENLPQDVFSQAEQKAIESDICFIVGTSAVVYPAAYIPITAKQNGAYLIEINIDRTEISSSVDYS
ncbi:MAG: NAD-dependent deacylase, partial [Ignavibacteriae bacterium]|nr:NAD-dependent deacylase [Ignavibacteriota bacterium]